MKTGECVDETLQRMAEAVRAGDFQRWRELWHPDAQVLAPNTPAAIGRANILRGRQRWFEQWTHDMRIRCDEIQVAGRWAFASGGLTLRSVSLGEEKAELLVGGFLAVLSRNDAGRWLLYRFCYNSGVPLAGDR